MEYSEHGEKKAYNEEAEIEHALRQYRRSKPSLEEARRLLKIYTGKHAEAVLEGTGNGDFHYTQKKALERYIAEREAKQEIMDSLKAVTK